MLTTVVTAPEAEPITLAELKEHLKVLHATEDSYLETLIVAARGHIEKTSGAAFMTQTIDGFLPAFPSAGAIVLPRNPVVSVAWVKYRDRDGNEQTLSPSSYHFEPAAVRATIELLPGQSWPATQAHPRAVNVRWVAGAGEAESDLKHAMKLLCAHWYFNRELDGDAKPNMPFAVEALTQKYRTHGWM